MKKGSRKESTVKEQRSAKKAYVAPKLEEYGNMAKLTQTGGFTNNDGAVTQMTCL